MTLDKTLCTQYKRITKHLPTVHKLKAFLYQQDICIFLNVRYLTIEQLLKLSNISNILFVLKQFSKILCNIELHKTNYTGIYSSRFLFNYLYKYIWTCFKESVIKSFCWCNFTTNKIYVHMFFLLLKNVTRSNTRLFLIASKSW